MSKSNLFLAIGAIVVIALGIFIFRFSSFRSDGGDKVAATIFPLYDITRNIAGDSLEVVLVLPAGASPHTFDLSPGQVRSLSGSLAVFAIGHGLDDWVGSVVTSSGIGPMIVVDQNISLYEFAGDGEDEDWGVDPHYWLSVPNAMLIAEQIRDELSEIYPDRRDLFERNFTTYKEKLDMLDAEIRGRLSALSTRKIATFHNGWGYFAQEYGLEVVATFEEYPGEEPTAQYLASFQNRIREEGVSVIFAEPQFSTIALAPIAQDLGVTISVLDPLGGIPGRESYEELMRNNTDTIIQALQ